MPPLGRVPPPRGYDPSVPESIEAFGLRVKGMAARQVDELTWKNDPASQPTRSVAKNALGDVMEAYFGIPKNNSPLPDFPDAKVELKVLPLKRGARRGDLSVKEPTSIGMIHYDTLPDETWIYASVHAKLDQILFVFFSIDSGDLLASTVRDVALWRPEGTANDVLMMDWERTRGIVANGEAHLLSESQAIALAARRKGSGGPGEALRTYPGGKEPAPSRAWALKTAFTRQIYEQKVLHGDFESLIPLAYRGQSRATSPLELAKGRALSTLTPYMGWRLSDIAQDKDLDVGSGKALAASIIKRSLGFKNVNAKIAEFEQWGVDVKTLNLNSNKVQAFEAVSFPVVDLVELPATQWEGIVDRDGVTLVAGAELAEQLSCLLFVPTFGAHRSVTQGERRLGRAFFWSPSKQQWVTIEREWRMFQTEVEQGKAKYDIPCEESEEGRSNRLTPASRTQIIHMRPHGRDACDEYLDPKGNRVTKQCFWLNKSFIESLVKREAWPPPQERGPSPSAQAR